MINTIINFLKSLFIKDKEEHTMEALHNISIPRDDPFVFPYSGIDLVEEKQEMSKDDDWATPVHNKSKQEEPWGDNFPCYGSTALPPPTNRRNK